MPNPENVIGKGKQFSKDYQPARNGRKPKLYTMAKKTYNLGLPEFRDIVSWMWQMPRAELRRIGEDDQTPIWMATIARALYNNAGSGNTKTINELADRLWGRTDQKLDVTTNGKEIVHEPVIINRVRNKEDLGE